MTARWRIRALECAVGVLTLLGIWASTHATWVLTHGGNRAFDGAFDYPRWAAVHFLGGLAFVVILPFQLSSRARAALPRAHRVAGRVAALAGLAFAGTGLALPIVMPARPFGERAFMMTVGVLFTFLLWRGVAAARRHDFITHRRWMLRVTAGALSPLTQRAMFPFFAALGIDSLGRFWDLFVTSLWLSSALNFIVVEWWIRRTEAAAARRFTERNAPESVRSLGALAPPESGAV
ncbi:MAG TPA: DUF2306 domain-containing protein [Vicinamibacterales bacterium]|nr:DUF2306 domain-containing protein [Vicinamibacterales bacterium]